MSTRIIVPGKWVLAGEHSVLRGGTAVALPHPEFRLTLDFAPGGNMLRVLPSNAEKVIREMLVGINVPNGELKITSTIPIGAGLGSSAALCVATARWLGYAPGSKDELDFATRLEHRFHGKSSGMDVAVISQGKPIAFSMKEGARPLPISRLPRFTFHDTGLRSATRPCIEQVERFRIAQPELAAQLDDQMSRASSLACDGLLSADLTRVSKGMRLAQECFEAWKLVPPEARRIADRLVWDGALASKITGAGAGGYVVGLWGN